MEQTAVNSLGFAHFLTQTDGVGQAVLGTLLLLSIASWYLIVTRALANTLAQRKADAFLQRFWLASSLLKPRCIHNRPITPLRYWCRNRWRRWPTAARTISQWRVAWQSI